MYGALPWKTPRKGVKRSDVPMTQRDPRLPRFVIDTLHPRVLAACESHRRRIDAQLFSSAGDDVGLDGSLARPWRDALARAERLATLGQPAMKEELERIRKHVQRARADR